jgi:hypothetical protein
MGDNVSLKNFYQNITQKTSLMLSHQFLVELVSGNGDKGSLESILNNQGDFSFYVKSSTIPKVEIDQTEVAFLSQKFVIPKQVKFGETWNCNILIDRDLTMYNALYTWQEKFASLKNNGGRSKSYSRCICKSKIIRR